MTFEGYKLRSPITIVFPACFFLNNWAGLYGAEERDFIRNGAQQLIWKAMEIVRRHSERGQSPGDAHVLRITGD